MLKLMGKKIFTILRANILFILTCALCLMKLIFKADALLNKLPLTLCILEPPKWVL